MQPFTAELAASELSFPEDEITIGAHRYLAEFVGGRGWVREVGVDGETKHEMLFALGGKNVYYFLTRMERGRLQTLPLAYDVRQKSWFDMASSGMRHIPEVPEEAIHWTAPEYTFNTSCHGCHVSQVSANYDLATDSYFTTWTEPGINCESCHGPAGEHILVCAEAPEGTVPDDLEIVVTRNFTEAQTNTACAPCHAKKVDLTAGFTPGDRFFDRFDPFTMEHLDFYPDGRDLGENYTYTQWLMNPCARSGAVDCLHCHTSSGRFRQKDAPNQACLPCHEQRVSAATEHTHHDPESPGSLCISCHMPMTEFARMRRSDHSFRPPMPSATIAFGSPNACNVCHRDQDAAWADQWVRAWRTRDYQTETVRLGRLIVDAREQDWRRLDEMLAYVTSEHRDEVFAASLVRLLDSCEDRRKWPAMIAALRDPSPLIRSSAASNFDGHLTPESVPALLRAAGDEYRLVRVRAAMSLAPVPPGDLDAAQEKTLRAATKELEDSMRHRPDDFTSHFNRGNFLSSQGRFVEAIEAYETSVRVRPDAIRPRINASLIYNHLGENARAEAVLRDALELDPNNVPANLNLGMLLGEFGRIAEAERHFRAVWHADDESHVAAFNLCVIAGQEENRLPEAMEWCERAVDLQPAAAKYAYTLAFYRFQTGDTAGAVSALRQVTDAGAAHPGSYWLLGDILEREGESQQAIQVYQAAADNASLPAAERRAFAGKIRTVQQR